MVEMAENDNENDARAVGYENKPAEEKYTQTSTWYVNRGEEAEELESEDVIDYDFIKLGVRHIIKNRKIVKGSLLITPRNVVFDPISSDPLDQLEPEMFQVAFPTKRITDVKIFYDYFGEGDEKTNIYQGPKIIERETSSINEEDLLFKKELEVESEEEEEESIPKLTFISGEVETENKDKDDSQLNDSKEMFIHIKMDTENINSDSGYISSYGSPDLQQSYWFVISSNQAVHAHTFFTTWSKDTYFKHHKEDDFENISDVPDFKFVEDFFRKVDAPSTKPHENVEDLYKNAGIYSIDMADESQLLTMDKIKDLSHNLPKRCLGHSWSLVFSTWRDGYSLLSLYRNFSGEEGPALVVIKCSDKVST